MGGRRGCLPALRMPMREETTREPRHQTSRSQKGSSPAPEYASEASNAGSELFIVEDTNSCTAFGIRGIMSAGS